MIYDCFTFFDEVDLTELRMEILDPYVDRFVIAEADTTHSGLDKPFIFEENYKRFQKWEHKISYLKITGLPKSDNRWLAENAQRRALIRGVESEGMVMISDADEIPHMTTWDGNEGVFQQLHSYYKLNKIVRRPWNGTVIVRASRLFSSYGKIDPQDCRNFRDILPPVGFGWHFSWLGNAESKVKAFAHGELEAQKWVKDDNVSPGENIPLETIRIVDFADSYPEQIVNDPLRFAKWIAPEEGQGDN